MVWAHGPPRTAEHSVQIYISELRKALTNGSIDQLIDTRPPGYVINVSPDSIDTKRFERLVRDGLSDVRSGHPDRGHPKLEQALAMWKGEALADFAYEDFAQGFVRSLAELRSDALEALAALELERGRFNDARDLARKAIEADPLREEPRRVMMLALYQSGRQADALRHFNEYQQVLASELGIETSEALRYVEEQILLQDPVLLRRPQPESEFNPYRGLRAFKEEDGEVYFGRESLVSEVLERLENGPGFVSIVGPSGSGKSSAARAGVIPVMRQRGRDVEVIQPGPRPLWELAGAFEQVASGSRASLLRRFESDPRSLADLVKRPLVLILDQFEELFTLSQPDTAVRLSELLSNAVRDDTVPLEVVVTLRADYYDKPLSIPALAAVFSDTVVSVKPMTPQEIERAIVEPAKTVGTSVEPALVAQLVADMADNPGALPLLQFTLFELFDKASGGLTLEAYERLGGINGALTGGADDLLAVLDAEGRDLAEQLLMRMVQKGRALSTSRPVAVRDLIDLSKDSVLLQKVLEAFGSRRLVTFDRDASGAAIVEIAHEYLISEWPQMENWLTTHSVDLDRLYVLEVATADWVEAGRSDDYLLRGERLARFERWQSETTMRLTTTETDFLQSSVSLRDRERKAEAEREAHESALKQRAKRRLWYFGGAVAALAAALTLLVVTLIPEPPPDLVIMYDFANADTGFSGLIRSGMLSSADANGLDYLELSDWNREDVRVMGEHVANGTGLVLLQRGSMQGFEELPETIQANPDTWFVWMDCDDSDLDLLGPNETCILSDELELGFLAGAVAAHKTQTGNIGIVVGVNSEFMYPFHRGFVQGAAHVDPDVVVASAYLSFDTDGFASWPLGQLAGDYLIEEGSDVIFHAAAFSGWGVAEAVHHWAEVGNQPLWVIGVDEDMYAGTEAFEWDYVLGFREQILTSIVKRIDLGVAAAIDQYSAVGAVENIELNIASGGIDYVSTGGHLDEVIAELEAIKGALRDGAISVENDVDIEVRMLVDLLRS